MFKLGVLFSLFVTQFFDFYDNQLAAASIFLLNILVLIVLNTIIEQQKIDGYLVNPVVKTHEG